MTSVCSSGFRAVENGSEDNRPVSLQFGSKANSSPFPDIHSQSLKGDACLGALEILLLISALMLALRESVLPRLVKVPNS